MSDDPEEFPDPFEYKNSPLTILDPDGIYDIDYFCELIDMKVVSMNSTKALIQCGKRVEVFRIYACKTKREVIWTISDRCRRAMVNKTFSSSTYKKMIRLIGKYNMHDFAYRLSA